MASNLLPLLLFRLVLPVALLGAALFRYNGMSFVYLVCLLLVPLIRSSKHQTSKAALKLQSLVLCISVTFILSRIIFQVVLLVNTPYGYFFKICTNPSTIAQQVGFYTYNNCEVLDIVRLILPDIVVFGASLFSVLACRSMNQVQPGAQDSQTPEAEQRDHKAIRFIRKVLPFLVGLLLLLGGIVQPNVLCALYFIVFLVLSVCWAFHLLDVMRNTSFLLIKTILTVYAALHVLLLYLYQFPFLQEHLQPKTFLPRLLGLPAIIDNKDCTRSREIVLNSGMPAPVYVYPFTILLLYWILAADNRLRSYNKHNDGEPENNKKKLPWWNPQSWCSCSTEATLLLDGTLARTYGAAQETGNTSGDANTTTTTTPAVHVQGMLSGVLVFLMRQSYIAALIIMMAWSIIYHSWLTFVLLLWACLTWVTPFARRFCMMSSPYLVVYAELLLVLQYIYGMDLKDAELPVKEGKFDFVELGLIRSNYAVVPLLVQTIFTWVFLVTLRQYFREKRMKRQSHVDDLPGEMALTAITKPIFNAIRRTTMSNRSATGVAEDQVRGDAPSNEAKELMMMMRRMLAKYWILVCCCAFLLVALQSDVSLFQIFYMVIFLVGFVIYQFSLRTWKLILRPLWWFMVVYSIVILLMIYTFQFDNIRQSWLNGTHLTDQLLYDIGLRQQGRSALFLELLLPTIFSIVLVVQLHFFHKPQTMKIARLLRYRKTKEKRRKSDMVAGSSGNSTGQTTDFTAMSMTDNITASTLVTSGTGSDEESDEEPNYTIMVKLRKTYVETTVILWRLVEIHWPKLVSLVIMLVSLQQVSAVNAVFILLLVISMLRESVHKVMNYVTMLWASIVVLVIMFYQLSFVNKDLLPLNCTVESNKSLPIPLNTSHFASNTYWLGFYKSDDVSLDIRGYLFIVLLIVVEKVIKHHQEMYRFRKRLEWPPVGVLFPNVERAMADKDVVNCMKYLCNNFFNLFGLEINLMVMVGMVCLRGDAIAVLHSLWICLFMFLKRKRVEKAWPFYVIYMALMIPIQYFMLLGWPPGLCKDYPWTNALGRESEALVHWLFLIDVQHPLNQRTLTADFFQFLCACCQSLAFQHESTNQNEDDEQYNPPDFMINKTWLDFIKIVVLDDFLWLTLSIVYITAQSTTSLFNSGFIVGCFFFLWHGQGLYLRPRQQMKRWWKTFLVYILFVIVCKLWLQLVSCVYIQEVFDRTGCYLIQLLNLYCIRMDLYNIQDKIDSSCVTENDPGLALDTVCFIFVLIQFRIFKCSYFKYVIREHRRQSEMSSRGAELVEERLECRLAHSIERDRKKMQYIRNKVAKLKEKLEELNPKHQEPLSHYEAIYGGDYNVCELSDSEPDNDDDLKDIVKHDVTFTPPQQTSERRQPPVDEDEPDQQPEETASVTSLVPLLAKHKKSRSFLKIPSIVNMLINITQTIEDDSGKTSSIRRRRGGKQDSQLMIDDITGTTANELEPKKPSYKQKVAGFMKKGKKFVKDMADTAIKFFNETSMDYRHIADQLQIERKEKARTIMEEPSRNSPSGISVLTADQPENMEEIEQEASNVLSMTRSVESSEDTDSATDTWSLIPEGGADEESWQNQDSTFVRFLVAFYYALLANTDLLCYTFMIINHIYYACILSMPLPFFVFLWGMLSIPRPTKHFWITVITYVELVIVVKYVFQFQFPSAGNLNFNECSFYENIKTDENYPLCPPRIIGIERNRYSAVLDLVLLLVLFFHRFALKSHGLWREKAFSDEEFSPRSSLPTGDPASTSADNSQQAPGRLSLQPLAPKRSICSNMKQFILRMLNPEIGTGAVDVYAWMFGAQFIIFIIILSSWSDFSSSEDVGSNFATIIKLNVVPKTFLYMLLTQFLLIVLDRYMYMRKLLFPKLVYLAVLVLSIHMFLFIAVPEITKRSFVGNVPAVFLYLFMCIYFGLSAYQVRCGYPTRILGNFLTKNYTVTSGLLFQGIQSIPFLLELRSVLDWVCTQTTLNLNHWLKMEDIYANIFVIKCWRDSEKTWPQSRGLAYWISSKLLIGGILVTLLIVVIWFPLLLMSFISSAYIPNPPVQVTFTLTVGGYQPLFQVSTQQQFLNELSTDELNRIVKRRAKLEGWDTVEIQQILHSYKSNGNIIRVKVLSNSSAIWTISPPSRDFLIKDLESNDSLSLQVKYVFDREPNTTQAAIVQESVTGISTRNLAPGHEIRMGLSKILRNPSGEGNIAINNLFPSFVRVPASGPISAVSWLPTPNDVNCTLVLRRGSVPYTNATVEWWEIIQNAPQPVYSHSTGYLEIISLNDFVPPLHLSFFASSGIIGLYVGFVWLVGKFVRLFFTSISYRIIYDELPNVDRLLKLLLEIYMVRESKELELEEDLFAKLLFLYRSPETLIKWTKYKRLKMN